jgi:hypothetical protein
MIVQVPSPHIQGLTRGHGGGGAEVIKASRARVLSGS